MGSTLIALLAGWLTLAAPPPPGASDGAPDAVERAESLTMEGWELWKGQDFEAAIARFHEAVKLDPDAANAWNGLGWALFNSGNAKDAVPAFEKCVTLDPNHAAGLNGLGQIYLMWGGDKNLAKAEKFLTKSAKSPGASAAWFGLARLYLVTGKYDEAKRWISKSLREQPGDQMLMKMLAAAKEKRLPEDLKRELAPSGKMEADSAESLAQKGWQYFSSGKPRSAEQSFRRALAKDPEYLPAINGLGFSLLNSGKPAEAKEYFEKYLAVESDSPGPLNGLARCLKETGDVEGALKTWQRGYDASPGPTANAVGLATTYLETRQFEKAIPFFEELVRAQPGEESFQKGLEAARNGLKEAN